MVTESYRSWFAQGAASKICLAAIAAAVLASAQVPLPGQEPVGPPPQPGQLGSNQNSSSSTPASSAAGTAKPGESTATVPGENSDYTFRAGTHYVLVPTTVLDPDGHGYVNGLKVSDFTVYDNGKPQKIDSEMTEQPVSVVLAVQANSEVEPLLPEIRRSGILLQGLVTGQEGDAAILAFDHRMQVLQDFTNDPSKLDDAMHRLTSGSSTAALVDAIRQADEMLIRHDRQNSQRRRVIILMSRNIDKGSQAKLDETIRKMQFDNVIVYCIDISRFKTALLKKPDYPRPPNGGQPAAAQPNITGATMSDTNVVQQMDGNVLNGVPPIWRGIHDLFRKTPAEVLTYFTGGQLYSFSNQRALEDALTDIGKNLNSQYMLTYNLSNKEEPGFHNIRVEVDRPGLKVKTRIGYWWGGGQM